VQLLKPHTEPWHRKLWAALSTTRPTPENGSGGVRAGSADADDSRWQAVAPAVADVVVRASPVEFVAWSEALEPVRGVLVPELIRR